MIKCVLTKGIPGSGKSTWAKEEIAKDPNSWVRVNNDDLRASFNGSVWSKDYEKIIVETRNFIIKEALRKDRNIIIDNLNLTSNNFESVCKIAKSLNKEIEVSEKVFYIDLETAVERDSKRQGSACVGRKVIEQWWNKSGKEQFKFYQPKIETFMAEANNPKVLIQDPTLPDAVICDLDGTIAIIGNRSPYDASQCDVVDLPNEHVIAAIKLYYNAGHHIIFCSGREDKDREPTVRFIEKYLPGTYYQLHMRKSGDTRKDSIIKEEIFDAKIKNQYYIKAVFDDRLMVCRLWHELGLPLFRVGSPDANF